MVSAHGVYNAHDSSGCNNSGLLVDAVLEPSVEYKVIVLFLAAYLDNLCRDEFKSAAGVDFPAVYSCLMEKFPGLSQFLMEEEILLGKLPVLGTQGEVFRNGLCASPDGSHHSVCTAGYPDPLQFCIAVENMQRRDLQYDEDRE